MLVSHSAAGEPPHADISVTPPVLFMWKALAGDDWFGSSTRAGASRDMSALALPISTTTPIRSLALAMPAVSSAATAARALSLLASVTLIVPVYGLVVPLTVMFVLGANVTAARPVATVKFRAGTVPDGTRIAAVSVPLTLSTKLSGSITTGGRPGAAATDIPAPALLFTGWSSAPANRYPRGSGGSEASGAMSI